MIFLLTLGYRGLNHLLQRITVSWGAADIETLVQHSYTIFNTQSITLMESAQLVGTLANFPFRFAHNRRLV